MRERLLAVPESSSARINDFPARAAVHPAERGQDVPMHPLPLAGTA